MTKSEYKDLVAKAKKYEELCAESEALREILCMPDKVGIKYGSATTFKYTIVGTHGNGTDHIDVSYRMGEDVYCKIRDILGERYSRVLKKIVNLK